MRYQGNLKWTFCGQVSILIILKFYYRLLVIGFFESRTSVPGNVDVSGVRVLRPGPRGPFTRVKGQTGRVSQHPPDMCSVVHLWETFVIDTGIGIGIDLVVRRRCEGAHTVPYVSFVWCGPYRSRSASVVVVPRPVATRLSLRSTRTYCVLGKMNV